MSKAVKNGFYLCIESRDIVIMTYEFIADFYKGDNDETPIYKTHLTTNHDQDSLIMSLGMKEEIAPGWYVDYFKEVTLDELTENFPLNDNPELSLILFEGVKCTKIILRACEVECGFVLGCNFGKSNSLFVRFAGNSHDSNVTITDEVSSKSVKLKLGNLKEKMEVITVFEVMEKLQKEYSDCEIDTIQLLKK